MAALQLIKPPAAPEKMRRLKYENIKKTQWILDSIRLCWNDFSVWITVSKRDYQVERIVMMYYLNAEYCHLKMNRDLVRIETVWKSLCSCKLIQSLQCEYFIELSSNIHRLNYLAADSKVSGCDGAPFQVSTKASTFGIFLVKNQNSASYCRPNYSHRNVK